MTPTDEDNGKPAAHENGAWVLKWPEDGDYLTNDDPDLPEWSPKQSEAHRFPSLKAARYAAGTWGGSGVQPIVVRLVRNGAR